MTKPRPLADRFHEKYEIEEAAGCWIWKAATNSNGYGVFGRDKHGFRNAYAHRVSYELHCGPIPEGLQIAHRCDRRACVAPHHLFPATPKENTADMVAKGRDTRGTKQYLAKLTEDAVAAIRSSDATTDALAAQYGVSPRTIIDVRTRQTWKHIP